MPPERVESAARLTLSALPGLPRVTPGDELAPLIGEALGRAELRLEDGDVLTVTSKLFSRAEGRFVDLASVAPSAAADTLAAEVGKDPRLVELILSESVAVSRKKLGALIVRHRLGFVSANAAIDSSNAAPPGAAPGSGPWVLLLPEDPDASAARLRAELVAAHGARVGVLVTDSHGRPFRRGSVGVAVGAAGLPVVSDERGRADLDGRMLEFSMAAVADQVAAAADLVCGQGAEGRPVVHLRGLRFDASSTNARDLVRDPGEDLYA